MPDFPLSSVSSDGLSRRTTSVLRILTHTSNTSALVFSTFLTIHLASPVAGLIGGAGVAERASRFMLLGRAYYHPVEAYLVFGSAGVHLVSSVTKRLILLQHRIRRRRQLAAVEGPSVRSTTPLQTSSKTTVQRIQRSLAHVFKDTIAWTGYALIPFFVHHVFVNRNIPSSSSQPIASLSPSELDYGFVEHGLSLLGDASRVKNAWGLINWAGYTGLITLAVGHAVWGGARLTRWFQWNVNTRFGKGRTLGDMDDKELITNKADSSADLANRRKSTTSSLQLRWIGITTILFLSLLRLDHEGRENVKYFSRKMVERYEAVYRSIPWLYRY